ncbi:hypothetical protein E4V51_32740, partial [Paenibacillus sp. 28ISP30-2]|nr:hypothetical protein [Paenibacillus sp. 28ISP30-2]
LRKIVVFFSTRRPRTRFPNVAGVPDCAQKSKTRRHLIEFWMIEPEMAFVDHEESLRVQEQFVSHIVQSVLKNCSKELETIGRDVSKLEQIQGELLRIKYDEAIALLQGEGLEIPGAVDLGAANETDGKGTGRNYGQGWDKGMVDGREKKKKTN